MIDHHLLTESGRERQQHFIKLAQEHQRSRHGKRHRALGWYLAQTIRLLITQRH